MQCLPNGLYRKLENNRKYFTWSFWTYLEIHIFITRAFRHFSSLPPQVSLFLNTFRSSRSFSAMRQSSEALYATERTEAVKNITFYVAHQCRCTDFWLSSICLIIHHHCNKQRVVEKNSAVLFWNILPKHINLIFTVKLIVFKSALYIGIQNCYGSHSKDHKFIL